MAEGVDQGLVGAGGDEFKGGVAAVPGEVERGGESEGGDEEIRPGVECPLASPGELPVIREWKQVGNGPLVAIGTTCPDEIPQQMQMEAEKDQAGGLPTLGCEGKGESGDDEAKAEVVTEHMVIVGPPGERMRRFSSENFGDQSQAIEVGNAAGEGDHSPFSAIEAGGIGEEPAAEEMSDGAQ